MAGFFSVNDCVRIDGNDRGRIVSIVQPLGTYNVYNVRLDSGLVKQLPRYRLTLVPETVSRNDNVEIEDIQIDMGDDIFDDIIPSLAYDYDFSDIDTFVCDNRNKNTWRKTQYDTNMLIDFMVSKGDHRTLETVDSSELCDIISSFLITAKKSNGEDYEPSSLRSKLSSFDRYLKSKGYSKSLFNDKEFSKLRDVLSAKQKLLKKEGMGNLPQRSESLTPEEVEKLYISRELGPHNPESIINTLWWNNTRHFGLRSVTPHRNMQWGDVTLKCDTDGREFLEFVERQTKTRTGSDTRNVRSVPPRAWATGGDRCPVHMYKLYATLRPKDFSAPDYPFYLATNSRSVPPGTHPWFKRGPIGINKLGSIMKRMAGSIGISGKRLTNHSARKTMIQTLKENNVPNTEIMQLSGHRNVQSINNYSHISTSQHRQLSQLISTGAPSDLALAPHNPAAYSRSNDEYHPLSLPRSESNVTHRSNCLTFQTKQSEFVNSIFAAPIYGGTININFCGDHAMKQASRTNAPIQTEDEQ